MFSLVAMRVATSLLVSATGAGDYSTLLNGPQCHPYHHGNAGQPYWARRRRMTVLVDSVLLSGGPQLRAARPCWRVHLRGRPALMIRIAEQEIRASRRHVARLVVIGLGYNSLWERHRRHYWRWAARFDHEAGRLLRTLRRLGARQFVWVTLREPTAATVPPGGRAELGQYAWYFPYVNQRLRRLDRRRRDLVLADWAAVSRHRGLTYDSIHLNQHGAGLMERTIRRAVFTEALRQSRARAARTGTTAASARTYVPNCGNTSFLSYKPNYWSAGCTGGSLNMVRARWKSWHARSARATGRAELREPCGNQPCYKAGVYKARARLRLSRPRSCNSDSGQSHRYFSRASFSVRFRRGNPFGYRAGWRTSRINVPPDAGNCSFP